MGSYKAIGKQKFSSNQYAIVPIRYEDRLSILHWRNDQIYHLRQDKPLNEADQDHYFKTIVNDLFNKEKPNQLIFSFLEDNKCIGYGGLVHINWIDKNAEISFVMETKLEKNNFARHWKTFLHLIEEVAFKELKFYKIFTFAYDLRPHLYAPIEASGFEREAVLKKHCYFNGAFKDVIIHSKFNNFEDI